MPIGRISGQMLKSNLERSGTDLTFETNLLALDVTNSRVGIGTASPAVKLHVSSTDALRIPSGTTAQRPGSPANGDIRYNTTLNVLEGYNNGSFTSLAGEGIDNIVEDTTPQLGGNLDVNGNSIVSVATNQNITITPNGTGEVVMSKVNIGDGEIDGTVIGANSAAAGTFTNFTANGTIDIDSSGNMDGIIIGANTAAAGTFTNLTATTNVDIDDSGGDGEMDGVVIGANTAAAGTFTTLTTTGNTTIGGNLTVNGTTTTIDSTTLTVEDPLIQLAKNNSGGAANAFDQGLFFNRGSLANVSFLWDESADEFVFANTGSEDGTTAGNVTIDSYANIRAAGITVDTITLTGIEISGNNITASRSNDDLVLGGSGTGVVTHTGTFQSGTIDVNGGAIDGAIIGANSAAAGTFTDLTANGTIDIDSSGNMDGIIIGANTRAAGSFTTVNANAGVSVSADSQNLSVGAGGDFTVSHDGSNTAIANTTGNLTITTAASSAVVINEGAADVDFRVEGSGETHALFVDAGNDRVGVATSSPSYVLDASGSTDAFRVPVGNTAQRPTAATGIIRFNSQTNKYEACNDGSTFVELAIAGDTPTISKVSATGDGSTTTITGFFSSAPESAANVLVFIDNVYQEPTENYTVSGTNITFTSAPHSGARIFAIVGFDNTALPTGGVARTQTSAVSFTSSATNIMTFNASTYRSAELLVTITDSTNSEYSVSKVLVVHDGTTAYGSVYGVTNSGSADLATITFNHDGSNTVEVKATSTGGTSSARVQYSVQPV